LTAKSLQLALATALFSALCLSPSDAQTATSSSTANTKQSAFTKTEVIARARKPVPDALHQSR